ncbi:hypothetical protein Q8A67_012656 [Cirrhinus molitorella]|uniref:Uncharacterized protein n=1 Tax=Cirrhinus molitorella TaxID=172907 RepID=A0AA88TP98_9TELE|nr:hypothetical protein Q8A67_012656 [Cirrhinus molitorella]
MAETESASRRGGRRDLPDDAPPSRLSPLRVLLWSYLSVCLYAAFWKRMRTHPGEALRTRTSGCRTDVARGLPLLRSSENFLRSNLTSLKLHVFAILGR